MIGWHRLVVASALTTSGLAATPIDTVTAQPIADASSRCAARVQPFDALNWLTGRGDSARFAAPMASRDASTCTPNATPAPRLRVIWPTLTLGAAGGLPDSRTDGALWAGRGLSAMVRAGVAVTMGPLRATLAPELWGAQNRPYDILASSAISERTDRSPLASPFYYGRHTLDLPSRMGVSPLRIAAPGQSAIWLSLKGADLGASTSNILWGPGVRDGLLFGTTAPGIPRAFVRTAHPIRTRIGLWRGEWFVGTLTESRWFDADTTNDRRTLGAARLEWSPTRAPSLVIGAYRAVQRTQRAAYPSAGYADVWRSTTRTPTDQMAGIFASYATSGMRAYLEIVSPHPPNGIRTFLATPGDDRGYQLGVERRIVRGAAAWLLHAEVMNTDPGISIRDRPARDFYAGKVVPHGWTHRGQLLGAGIGPGGTSQWFAADWIARRFSAGAYAERVRWNNEVLPRLYVPTIFRHDVTVRGGVRASVRTRLGGQAYDIGADASWGTRLNYLFQNTTWIRDYRTVDIRVPQLWFTVSPRLN
jgi:hypothetical protein